jgi:hypothetical protein
MTHEFYSSTLKLPAMEDAPGGAAVKWGPGKLRQAPAVLGNAMPKSGSHLIIQVLQGLTKGRPVPSAWLPASQPHRG